MRAKDFKTDIEIAHEAELLPIEEIAGKLGLSEDDIEHYGKFKAKVGYNKVKDALNLDENKRGSWCC